MVTKGYQLELCRKMTAQGECLRLAGHMQKHNPRPTLWNDIEHDLGSKTAKKITKAGFATPRGGSKGGYQNHVSRSSRVIIPYEHLDKVDLSKYEQGAVIRITAPQAADLVESDRLISIDRTLFLKVDGDVRQAFVLYRSVADNITFPLPSGWQPCAVYVDGAVASRRTAKGRDRGHYLSRVRNAEEGIQQGIFAPEYANGATNYKCQMLLTHLAYRTEGHTQDNNALHVRSILDHYNLDDEARWISEGIIGEDGVAACPLCNRKIAQEELHEMINPSEVPGLANSGVQLGETRSTLVNLYHLRPLLYTRTLGHTPENVAWGHAHCNTLLAQRASHGWRTLTDVGRKPNLELYWDAEEEFIRASDGRAWVSLTPMPAGTESFTAYLKTRNLDHVIRLEDDDLEY